MVDSGSTGTTAKALLSELLAARANVLSSGSTSSSDASASASASPLAAYLSSSPSTPIFALLSARGYLRLGDPAALLPLCEEVVRDLPEEASKVRAGNGKVVMRLVGEVVRRAEGRADAKVAREVLDRLLLAPESAP